MKPCIHVGMNPEIFLKHYYLKDDMVKFLKENHINAFGSKEELANRIYLYLKTGEKCSTRANTINNSYKVQDLTLDTKIEKNIRCSQTHREFFEREIGPEFSFNVLFQKWLKENDGKTYRDAVKAYYEIREWKKTNRMVINAQFEYNKYIRDFFTENHDKTFDDAIKCWNFKKNLAGSHHYEKSDLQALS